MLRGCQCLRGIWAVPLTTALTFGAPSIGQAVGLDGPHRSPSTERAYFVLSISEFASFFLFPSLHSIYISCADVSAVSVFHIHPWKSQAC